MRTAITTAMRERLESLSMLNKRSANYEGYIEQPLSQCKVRNPVCKVHQAQTMLEWEKANKLNN